MLLLNDSGRLKPGKTKGERKREMTLQRKDVMRLIKGALKTKPAEIGCYECLDEIHAFAEMTLVGKEIPEALRLVEEHIQLCGECRQEYNALLDALRGLSEKDS